jgi:P27 family predicted phage terminase small subunit
MGRPRKSPGLKILEGAQPCRINRDEPAPPKGAGPCPDHLDGIGRQAWDRVVHRLDEMGLLTLADGEAVALYASIYSRWRSAIAALDSDGLTLTTTTRVETASRTTTRTVTKTHALVAVANDCQRQMTRLLIQLGMTPSSRTSLRVAGKPEEDPLLAFLASPTAPHAKSKKPGTA